MHSILNYDAQYTRSILNFDAYYASISTRVLRIILLLYYWEIQLFYNA